MVTLKVPEEVRKQWDAEEKELEDEKTQEATGLNNKNGVFE